MIQFGNQQAAQALTEAMKSGDEEQIVQAWKGFHDSVVEQLRADAQEVAESNDVAILAQRGYRQLTSKEKRWYEKLIEALRSPDLKQAFTTILGGDDEDKLMPTTIIEDVFKAAPHKGGGRQANEFFARCKCSFRRLTGGKSRKPHAADGGKGIA